MSIKFIDRDGDEITVNAKVGDTLLDVAKDNDVDLEGIFQIITERKQIALPTHFVLHFFILQEINFHQQENNQFHSFNIETRYDKSHLVLYRASDISCGRGPAKFRYFCEIPQNSPKNAKYREIRQKYFQIHVGKTYLILILAIRPVLFTPNVQIYLETSSLQRVNNVPKLPGVLD